MKKKKDFITKKIKIPKGYKASELISDDDSGVMVFDKKKKKSHLAYDYLPKEKWSKKDKK